MSATPSDPLLMGDKDATIQRLWADREALTEKLRTYETYQVEPPIDASAAPGYELWSALMEDLRAEGLRRLTVKHVSLWHLTYEPTPSASSSLTEPLELL